MDFHEAMTTAKRGLEAWRTKPHNARWWRRIDGTPIPSDLLVNIAEAFAAADTSDVSNEVPGRNPIPENTSSLPILEGDQGDSSSSAKDQPQAGLAP